MELLSLSPGQARARTTKAMRILVKMGIGISSYGLIIVPRRRQRLSTGQERVFSDLSARP
jgi:hypothetical protein